MKSLKDKKVTTPEKQSHTHSSGGFKKVRANNISFIIMMILGIISLGSIYFIAQYGGLITGIDDIRARAYIYPEAFGAFILCLCIYFEIKKIRSK